MIRDADIIATHAKSLLPMIVAPMLYVIHVILAGLSFLILYLLGARLC